MKKLIWILPLIIFIASCHKEEDFRFTSRFKNSYSFEGRINSNDNSTLISNDGNVVICCNNYDLISILKVSKTGKKLFRKDYSIWSSSVANSIVQSADGALFICGETTSNYAAFRSDVLLLKTNSNGDTLWSKTYGGESFDYGINIMNTSDGNLLIAGKTESFGAGSWGDIYLLKLNLNGDTLWTKSYPDSGQQFPTNLMESSDGNYLITGNNMGEGMDNTNGTYLLKVDTKGEKIWDRKYGPNEWEWSYSSIELSNGEILTCGTIAEDGYSQVLLLRADQNGNYYRENKYGEPELSEIGYSIKKNQDDTYTITGTSYDATTGLNEIIALKIDNNGTEQWFNRFGESKDSNGLNLLKDSKNDNILIGNYGDNIYNISTGHYDDNIYMTILTDSGIFK
jgi:hypothetical protein